MPGPGLLLRGIASCAVVVALCGCGTGAQKSAIETAIANDAERAKAFEATARALDEHPEYVDQFYAVARRHPLMLTRFLADTTRDLHDPALAHATAELLSQNPSSLQETLVTTLDASKTKPPARAAIDRAVVERHDTLADILTDSHDAVVQSMNAVTVAVQLKPAARAAFLEAMRESAPRIAEILKSDPETMKVLLGALLRQEDRKGLDEFLKQFGLTK